MATSILTSAGAEPRVWVVSHGRWEDGCLGRRHTLPQGMGSRGCVCVWNKESDGKTNSRGGGRSKEPALCALAGSL